MFLWWLLVCWLIWVFWNVWVGRKDDLISCFIFCWVNFLVDFGVLCLLLELFSCVWVFFGSLGEWWCGWGRFLGLLFCCLFVLGCCWFSRCDWVWCWWLRSFWWGICVFWVFCLLVWVIWWVGVVFGWVLWCFVGFLVVVVCVWWLCLLVVLLCFWCSGIIVGIWCIMCCLWRELECCLCVCCRGIRWWCLIWRLFVCCFWVLVYGLVDGVFDVCLIWGFLDESWVGRVCSWVLVWLWVRWCVENGCGGCGRVLVWRFFGLRRKFEWCGFWIRYLGYIL